MINEPVRVIMGRSSIGTYKPDQIEEEKLHVILNAGEYNRYAGARQLLHFTVAQNKELIDKMVRDMVDIMSKSDNINNQKKAANPDYNTFYHAPTIVVVSGKEDNMFIEIDCAIATDNMLIAAESLGLNWCLIGSAELVLLKEDIKISLGIPDGFKPLYAVFLGYNATGDEAITVPRKENIINFTG